MAAGGLAVFDRSMNVITATNFAAKSAKLASPTFIYRSGIPKRIWGFFLAFISFVTDFAYYLL